LAFDAGIGHMRESVRFWKQILDEQASGEMSGTLAPSE
jgi:hypothetical protein